MSDSLPKLQLMRLVSPSLPIGAFSWSQGFESAVELGWVDSKDSAKEWISCLMQQAIGRLDLPVMIRIHSALQAGDAAAENYWSGFLYAARETRELQQEDKQIALALLRLMKNSCPEALNEFSAEKTYAGLFTRAACFYHCSLVATLEAFLWAWLENQVAAAGKLVPLGQTDMQAIIGELIEDIPGLVEQAFEIPDENIGFGLPGFIHASVKHETQYSRLFRS